MSLKQKLKVAIDRTVPGVREKNVTDPVTARALMLQGVTAAAGMRAREHIHSLADVEFSVFSQWGEDGILDWLIERIGSLPESFVEFGVETYRESNTRFLLAQRNWRGLIIDGSETNIAVARADDFSWKYDLTSVAAFITTENINELISKAGFTGEIGLLSIDVDGNDYWIWQAIDVVRPAIVITEFNTQFGDRLPLTIPYRADFFRTSAHYSNLYWGASIGAFDSLASSRGYTLVGTNKTGTNAFFVRNDHFAAVADRIADRRPRPSRIREGRSPDGALSHVRGIDRAGVIAELPVEHIGTGETAALGKFGDLFSPRWLALIEGGQIPAE